MRRRGTHTQAHDGSGEPRGALDGLDERTLAALRIWRSDDELLQRRVVLLSPQPLRQRERLGLRAFRHCEGGESAPCSACDFWLGTHS